MRSTVRIVDFHQEPTVLSTYLRALGETGRLNELVLTFAESEPRLQRSGLMATALAD